MGWFSKGAGTACAFASGFCERIKICAFSTHQVINTLDFSEPARKCFVFVTLLEADTKGKFWVHSRFNTTVQLFIGHVRVSTSEEAVLILDGNQEIPEGTGVLVELEKFNTHDILPIFWKIGSVATAIADVFRNNGISVGRNLAKILTIFEKID
jgi:hypothetical protein